NLQDQALQSRLANQGVAAGSDAYKNAYIPLNQARVDASNQAALSASQLAGQRQQQDITSHNVPMQTMGSLYGLSSGLPSPSFLNTPTSQIEPVDQGAYELANYQGQMAGYQTQAQAAAQAYQAQLQAQMQAQNGMMGGFFGLGGSILGGLGTAAGASAF